MFLDRVAALAEVFCGTFCAKVSKGLCSGILANSEAKRGLKDRELKLTTLM